MVPAAVLAAVEVEVLKLPWLLLVLQVLLLSLGAVAADSVVHAIMGVSSCSLTRPRQP